MIKVLELIDGGFIGGGQTHILSLAGNIDADKFKTVIAASPDGEFRNIAVKLNFEFEEITLPKFFRTKYLLRLDEICRSRSIDIIHSHGGIAGMYARFYKKRNPDIKVIHTIHGIHYTNSPGFMKKFISLSVEQYLLKYTDRFICVSDSDFTEAEKIKIIDPLKTSVIKNGIDTDKFSNRKKNKLLLTKYGIKQNEMVIGNISRFDFQKNQRFIISNAGYLFEKYTGLKILLAGDGKYSDECKRLAEATGFMERFIFPGEINNPEDFYSLFDVFIFPSLWEGLSISLIESMASGNCILASDIPANKELIINNSNGLTFNLNDNSEFISKLDLLIENAALRKELSENAIKYSENFSGKNMTMKIENEYLKLIN